MLLLVVLVGAVSGARPSASDANSQGVRITRGENKLRVEIDGRLFTQYIYNKYRSPILYPIIGPYGIGMTRNWPMRKAVPGESHDHPHHKSLWFAHGDVNGYDFWAGKVGKPGKIVQTEILKISSGPERGVIKTRNKWVGVKDGNVVCTDVRTLTFHTVPGAKIIDYKVTIHASHGDVVFGDTKEGTMAIRTHPALRLIDKGNALNSKGVRGRDVWGDRANWVGYWATINGKTVGVAIFDHPANPRHPTWWHARHYGLIAANPFGISYFADKPKGAGKMRIPAGESVTFRYRFVFHKGSPKEAEIRKLYRKYAQKGNREQKTDRDPSSPTP